MIQFFLRSFLLSCVITSGIFAEGKPYFFYRAVKNDTVIHILGSMHVGRPEDADYPAYITDALLASDQLVLEGEVRKEKVKMPSLALSHLDNHQTLKNVLPKKTYAELESIAESLSFPLKSLERSQPWLVEFMLSYRLAFSQGLVLEYGTEYRMLRFLKKKGKSNLRIYALEGHDEVFRLMSKISLESQINRLNFFLNYLKSSPQGNSNAMQKEFRDGNDQYMENLFYYYAPRSTAELTQFSEILLYLRNERMARRLDLLTRYPRKYFFITGAMHLIGERSIITHLKALGFLVERL